MKHVRTGIKETGTVFVTGIVFRPSRDDVRAVVGKLHALGLLDELVPEVKINMVLRYESVLNPTVRVILERAEFREYQSMAPFQVLALLWVLACWNYRKNQGPYPGTIKKQKLPRLKPVLDFRCPFCARVVYEPGDETVSRDLQLHLFTYALREHGKKCTKLIYLDRSVK
jgi:hypothetical protein